MEPLPLDPHEQQLLSVFDSYDHENVGSLDMNGLSQLCRALQLEDQACELIRCLLKDPKTSRATFAEFKDALLALLGHMQNDSSPNNEQENGSPDREVSPKYVYGSKKYGRRSRPRSDEIDEQNDLNKSNGIVSVQRSNSQSEVSSKKRKTNYKLKRCTSLPSTQRIVDRATFITSSLTCNSEFECTEEMLRKAWKNLGVGEDGYLNQTELILVCDAIGLHKLARGVIRQLSDKFTMDYDHRISFQELLEALQQDETWSEVLDSTPPSLNPDDSTTLSLDLTKGELFPDSRTFQYVTLGPDGNGFILAETLVDMWESVGIVAPKELVHELGFNSREINIVELAEVLEKELKGVSDGGRLEPQDPHVALLQANLSLYQSEIRCLKSVLEQLHAEREKLKGDVVVANSRADLLAQEVDDNHAKMERNTQNQVKLLEQRHVDILKELSRQHSVEKEHSTNINQNLEDKINILEMEVGKLKNDLVTSRRYSSSVEKENQSLSCKISELRQVKEVLTVQISTLEAEKRKYVEREQEQIEPLLSKLSGLQLENAALRDKNDEMVAEIESLSCQVSNMRAKVAATPTYGAVNAKHNSLDQSMDELQGCEGVGLGAKRRNDCSPTKDDDVLFGIGGTSPRLGKVRKFQLGDNLDVHQFKSNESGFDTLSSINGDCEESGRLRSKIAFLERILVQNSIPIPNHEGAFNLEEDTDSSETVADLKRKVADLERTLDNFSEIRKMIDKNGIGDGNLLRLLQGSVDKSWVDVGVATDDSCDTFAEVIERYETENKELSEKCAELENCVELLRTEYEKCEDYWQSKLDEERQIFEQEQSQSGDKLTDLIRKMSEYEEQFTNQDDVTDSRLPPIEETFNLEKQFTDLEQEFEDYKLQSERELCEKDEEISILKQKLTELGLRETAETLEERRVGHKMSNLSLCVVESTNLLPAETVPLPVSPPWTQPRSDSDSTNVIWNQNGGGGDGSESGSSTPCRPKRTRKHERTQMYKKNEKDCNKKEDFGRSEAQVIVLPVATVQNLNGRLHHLEQRCRQMQMALKQQHFYSEQVLAQARQHHRGEKTELQCILRSHQEKLDHQVRLCNDQLERLARSDMLVKELYVENSYLIAKVQRLEQQCHLLAQCNVNSCSV